MHDQVLLRNDGEWHLKKTEQGCFASIFEFLSRLSRRQERDDGNITGSLRESRGPRMQLSKHRQSPCEGLARYLEGDGNTASTQTLSSVPAVSEGKRVKREPCSLSFAPVFIGSKNIRLSSKIELLIDRQLDRTSG